jgi:hypothetical protein
LYDYIFKAYRAIKSVIIEDQNPDEFKNSCTNPMEKWGLGKYETIKLDIKPGSDSSSLSISTFDVLLYPKIMSYER